MAMPPLPKPSQPSEVAKAGTARRPSDSAAISLSATMVIHGAPNDSARITSNTVAMIQDDRVSTDGTPMRSCIIRPWLLRRREGDAIVTGVLPAFDALKQSAATYRPRRQQAAPLSSALVLGSSYWARNLSLSTASGEVAEVGTALCKTPTSVCRATQQSPKPSPRAWAMLWTIIE